MRVRSLDRYERALLPGALERPRMTLRPSMRILLIAPSVGPSPSEKTVWGKLLPSLALEILRALTPDEHQVDVLKQDREEIDFEDAVADEFRKRGKKVVLGGVEPIGMRGGCAGS
jgi:hypothetical protein